MRRHRQRTVVLGAGWAGLLAARTLSEFYESVVVIERDALPNAPEQRKGVWQGRHLHALMSRGSRVLEDLFPGLCAELVAAGAQLIDDGDLSRVDARMGPYGLNRSQKFADPAALTLYLASRPFLEFHVRRRVAALDNVTILERCDAVDPVVGEPGQIGGVRITNRDNGLSTVIDASLVVDASGRGARTPAFLDSIGFGRPDELRSSAPTTYSSQLLRIPDAAFAERLILIVQPGERGGLTACENGTWMLTVGRSTYDADPPTELSEMLSLAEGFFPPAVMAGLRRADPVGEVTVFRYTGAVWRRYDRMPRFPAGLLVIGDALCSVNPIYGQGMTLAALQALELRDALQTGDVDVAPRFFGATTRFIRPVWEINEARDHPPALSGRRLSLSERAQAFTTRKVLTAAANDIVLTEILQRIAQLVDPPTRLRDPALIPRVIVGNLRRRPALG